MQGLFFTYRPKITIMKKKQIKKTTKTKELIHNLTQTISKESKRVNGSDKQLIEKLKKILDKLKS